MAYEDYDLGLNSPYGSDYSSDERVQYDAESSYSIPSVLEHNRSETEIGIPKQCYCGAEPLLDTCYSRNDPGRRFYTCGNRDDGDMHVWKWWDLAVTEELRAKESIEEQVKNLEYATTEALEGYETDLNRLKVLQKESEVKNARLENLLADLGKKKPMFNLGTELVVCLSMVVGLIAIIIAMK